MRSISLFVFSFFISFHSGFSQDSLYVRKLIRELGSPEFHGRGYVNKGDEKAANYIAGEFKKWGLQSPPGAAYFQHFSFPVNTFPGSMEVYVNERKLQPGEDYIVQPGSSGVKGWKRTPKRWWLLKL